MTSPLVMVSTLSRTFLNSSLGSTLKYNSNVNVLLTPSWLAGTVEASKKPSSGTTGMSKPVLVRLSLNPSSSVKVTRTLMAFPSSALATVYVDSVAPEIGVSMSPSDLIH